MKGVAMIKDPDGYKIEIVKRGGEQRLHDLADAAARPFGLDSVL
jgi:hypothetical protein